MDQPVLVTTDPKSGIGTLTLNRPDKRNALSPELIAALVAGLESLNADGQVRVILLRGTGPAFCAGADLESLRSLQTASSEDNIRDSRRLADLIMALYRSPKPTIAALHGPALAGGAGLASACDFVVATPEATLGYPEVKIGFVAAIVMVILTRQVGERRARDLLLTGRALTGREAMDFGLVSRLVPPERLDAEVAAIAADLGRNSPEAMARTKLLLESVWDLPFKEAIAAASKANAQARGTADCREGVAAFLEKRKPVWSGRQSNTGTLELK